MKQTIIVLKTRINFQNIIGERNAFLLQHSIVYASFLISFVMASAVAFVSSFRVNIIGACTSLIGSLTLSIWFAVSWHYFINRERFYLILDDMEKLLNESITLSQSWLRIFYILSIFFKDWMVDITWRWRNESNSFWILFGLRFHCVVQSICVGGISLVHGLVYDWIMVLYNPSLVRHPSLEFFWFSFSSFNVKI